ncbi:MAG TPA: hypothetical protein VFN25_09125 [Dokdonella sp.]|uniref:hypothetical protein n=1 Tax=Dokdonella sp. TaxID=2291710 RepID=UPI002D7EA7FB|nr:hypothetical protein [Dokdonella sp.]HET9033054.1 hypothetical protein [Dokdonella sp.]
MTRVTGYYARAAISFAGGFALDVYPLEGVPHLFATRTRDARLPKRTLSGLTPGLRLA